MILLCDEDIGRGVPHALQDFGYTTISIAQRGWIGRPDVEWLTTAGQNGWLVLSSNKNMLQVPARARHHRESESRDRILDQRRGAYCQGVATALAQVGRSRISPPNGSSVHSHDSSTFEGSCCRGTEISDSECLVDYTNAFWSDFPNSLRCHWRTSGSRSSDSSLSGVRAILCRLLMGHSRAGSSARRLPCAIRHWLELGETLADPLPLSSRNTRRPGLSRTYGRISRFSLGDSLANAFGQTAVCELAQSAYAAQIDVGLMGHRNQRHIRYHTEVRPSQPDCVVLAVVHQRLEYRKILGRPGRASP